MKRRSGLNFARKRRNVNGEVVREICSWIGYIGVAIFFAFILVFFVGMRTSVIGVSMENTLYSGQQILVNRLSYLIFKPKKGDVIVFSPNGNRNTHYYVKRVVAVPGDSVYIQDGKLFVNNIVVDYGYDKIMYAGIAEEEIILEQDEYFVMGDNCNNSEDSRSGNIGMVDLESIKGRAWFHFSSESSFIGFVR